MTTLTTPYDGLDENLAAGYRFAQDSNPAKVNLALGTVVDAAGKPWSQATAFSSALTQLVADTGTKIGSYWPLPETTLAAAKQNLLDFLGLSAVAERTHVSFAAGGGTGNVIRAATLAFRLLRKSLPLATQVDSWPGYTSLAYFLGTTTTSIPLDPSELPTDSGLPVLQLAHNGTGRKFGLASWQAAGSRAVAADLPLVVDAPYLALDETTADSFSLALERSRAALSAIVETGALTIIAFSPTKIWNTFAYRPGGATVVVCRDAAEYQRVDEAMRKIARGQTGFPDLPTSALVRLMASDFARLATDHESIWQRQRQAEADWQANAAGTLIAPYFDNSNYGGLFRILPVQAGAVERLAEQGIHVVRSGVDRIRINVLGLPSGERAAEVVAAVAGVSR